MKLFSTKKLILLTLHITCLNIIFYIFIEFNTKTRRNTNNPYEKHFDDSKRLVDLEDFEYLIAQTNCKARDPETNRIKSPHFVILIHSAPLRGAYRKALRETWFHSDPRMISYFMLGKVKSASLQRKIEKENEQFNDIIQGNFIDSYHNLTYKHTMVLKWFTKHCADVNYLIKMDDDVFMNVPNVFEFLRRTNHAEHSVLGYSRKPMEVMRVGKWKITREHMQEDFHPECAFGPSLIYTKQFVRDAYHKSHTTRFHWVDDVFVTGFLRLQLYAKVTDIRTLIWSRRTVKGFAKNEPVLYNEIFLFTWNELKPDDHRILWNKTNTYRRLTNKNKNSF